jgi:hypothetical protein
MNLKAAISIAIFVGSVSISCYRPIYDQSLALAKHQGRSWSLVGSANFTGGGSTAPAIAIAPDGTPFVGFEDGMWGNFGSVMYLNGSNWSYLGSQGFTPGSIAYPSFAIDSSSRYYLASYDTSTTPSGKIIVNRYASSWTVVGAPGFSAGTVGGTTLAIDSSDTPYAGYVDGSLGNRATVMKFDGSSWVLVGPAAGFSSGVVDSLCLAIDAGGTPYLEMRDNGSGDLSVMKFDGVSWVYVGAQGFSSVYGWTANPSLAIDSSGTPYVAFQTSVYVAKAMRFNGTSWMDLGNADATSGGNVGCMSLAISRSAISKDSLFLAYARQISFSPNIYSVSVMKFKGSSWEIVGSPDFFTGTNTIDFIQIAISPEDGTPYVSIQCNNVTRVMAFQ